MIVGVGIDLIEIDRIRAALSRTPSLRRRIWTSAEWEGCADRVERLAARFAAKEAVAKAIGTGVRGFSLVDVEVISDGVGRPSVVLRGPAIAVAEARGVAVVHLSLTPSDAVAAAYAVAEG